MVIGNKSFKHYPKIRQEDLGSNTSNRFIDTMNISNLYLEGIGGKPSLIASDVKQNLFNCWKAKGYIPMPISSQAQIWEGSETIERHLT